MPKAEPVKPNSEKVAERLREHRCWNYKVKSDHGFKCDECSSEEGVLVVRLGSGEYGTRCLLHIGDLKPQPGQFNERATDG